MIYAGLFLESDCSCLNTCRSGPAASVLCQRRALVWEYLQIFVQMNEAPRLSPSPAHIKKTTVCIYTAWSCADLVPKCTSNVLHRFYTLSFGQYCIIAFRRLLMILISALTGLSKLYCIYTLHDWEELTYGGRNELQKKILILYRRCVLWGSSETVHYCGFKDSVCASQLTSSDSIRWWKGKVECQHERIFKLHLSH